MGNDEDQSSVTEGEDQSSATEQEAEPSSSELAADDSKQPSLDDVRVTTDDPPAAGASKEVGAKAYTQGDKVEVGGSSQQGQVVAHEAAHVTQQ